jgi:hypothetical protein
LRFKRIPAHVPVLEPYEEIPDAGYHPELQREAHLTPFLTALGRSLSRFFTSGLVIFLLASLIARLRPLKPHQHFIRLRADVPGMFLLVNRGPGWAERGIAVRGHASAALGWLTGSVLCLYGAQRALLNRAIHTAADRQVRNHTVTSCDAHRM